MNDLSILLYLADVFSRLSTFLGASSVMAAAAAVFTALFYCLQGDSPTKYSFMTDKEYTTRLTTHTNTVTLLGKTTKWLLIYGCIGGLISTLLPSKDTMYAIAVSEVGEEVVKTETAGKAVKALNNWLDEQIKPDTQTENKGE